jgi:hypothetical protein
MRLGLTFRFPLCHTLPQMPEQWNYRGRAVTAEDIVFIRELIAGHPDLSRRRLSAKLCEAWQWKQANGALRDMVCRGLLLMLHRAGASRAGTGGESCTVDAVELLREAGAGAPFGVIS